MNEQYINALKKRYDLSDIETQLIRDEGLKLTPYRCPAGKLTIGVGINLDAGISEDMAMCMLSQKLFEIDDDLQCYDWFVFLNNNHQNIILQMAYQMGVHGVLGFTKMIECLEAQDWEGAAKEMLDSRWAKQTPERAKRLAEEMKG